MSTTHADDVKSVADSPLTDKVEDLRRLYAFDEVLEMLADVGPDRPELLQLKAAVLRVMGRYGEVLTLLGTSARPSDTPKIAGERIAALDRLARFDEAAAAVASAPRCWEPPDPDGRLSTGQVLFRLACSRLDASRGEVSGALRGAEEGLALNPRSVSLFGWRLVLLHRLGRHEQIRSTVAGIDAMLARDAPLERVRRQVAAGRVMARLGDVHQSVTLLTRANTEAAAISTRQGDGGLRAGDWGWLVQAWISLISVYRTNGMPDEAWAVLREANTHSYRPPWDTARTYRLGNHPLLRAEHAWLETMNWHGESTRPLDDALARLRPIRPGSAPEIDWVRARIHRMADGVDELTAAVSDAPPDSAIAIELANAHRDHADTAAALSVYERALAHNPYQREAHIARLDILAAGDDAARLTSAVDDLGHRLKEDVAVLSMAAERLAQQGRYPAADLLFRQALATTPEHDLSWSGRIRAFAWAKDFTAVAEVAEEFEAAQRQHPVRLTAARVHLALGIAAGDRRNRREASEHFDKAAKLVADDPHTDPWSDLASMIAVWQATGMRWRHKPAEAVQHLAGKLSKVPHSIDLMEEHGFALLRCWRPTEALEAFDKARHRAPGNPSVHRGRVLALRAQNRPAEAAAAAEAAIRRAPQDSAIFCELAWLHGERSDFGDALDALDRALSLDPRNPYALAWRVIYLARRGEVEKALAAGYKAHAERPEYHVVTSALGIAHLIKGDRAGAIAYADRTLADHDGDVPFEIAAAAIYVDAGAPRHRQLELAARLARKTAFPAAVCTASTIYRVNRMFDRARQIVENCRAKGFGYRADLIGELAEIAIAEGDHEAALRWIKAARERVPESWNLVRRHAEIHLIAGEADRAIRLLEEEIERREVDRDLRIRHAAMLLEAGRFEEALSAALTLAPANGLGVRVRGIQVQALRALGRLDEATALAREVVDRSPESRRARLSLAACLDDQRRCFDAADVLAPVLEELPLYPSAIATASWIWRRLKQNVAATAIVRRGLELHPGDVGMRAELGWIAFGRRDAVGMRAHFRGILADAVNDRERAVGRTGLGWADMLEGEARGAVAHFDKAIAVETDGQDAYYGKALAHMLLVKHTANDEMQRHQRAAMSSVHRLLRMSDSCEAHQLAGHLAHQLGDPHSAREHFQRSIELHPVDGAYSQLGLLLIDIGETEAALDVMREGNLRRPNDADLLAALGTGHLAVERAEPGGGLSAALARFRQALRLRPGNALAARGLAAALLSTDEPDLDEAEHHLNLARRQLRTEPHFGRASVEADLDLSLADVLSRKAPVGSGEQLQACRLALKARRHDNAVRADRIIRFSSARLGLGRRLVAGLLAWRGRPEGLSRPALATGQRAEPHVSQGRWGRFIAGLLLLGLGGIWFAWFRQPDLAARVTLTELSVVTSGLVVVALASLTLASIARIRTPGFEMQREVPDAPGALDLMPNPPLSPPDPAPTAITNTPPIELLQTRLPRIAPVLGPLINGFYANRDTYYPWRRP